MPYRMLLLLFATAAASWAPGDVEIRGEPLAEPAARVLTEIMEESGVSALRVTSTSRTPAEQASVMYGYIVRHGADAAYRLYGAEGDAVIAVYEAEQRHGRGPCVEAMREEVLAQLPRAHANGRLMHTKPTHYVFDVAIVSVDRERRAAFVAAARRHRHVSRFLGPVDGEKEAYHLEIPKAAVR